MTATIDCSPTNEAEGPSATTSPPPNDQIAAAGIAARSEWPARDPRKIENAIPSVANTMTAARLRYAPWNDPNPTDTAPTAPNTPTAGCPIARATSNGTATPIVQRSAEVGSNCDQST